MDLTNDERLIYGDKISSLAIIFSHLRDGTMTLDHAQDILTTIIEHYERDLSNASLEDHL